MSTLQDYAFQQQDPREDNLRGLDVQYLVDVIKRRLLYFIIPFCLLIAAGFYVAKTHQPLFRAEGKILVEAPAVPADLVHPTITESADQRFELIKRRILSSDNLITVINRYNLFPNDRQSVPLYVLLALMRARVQLTPVPLSLMTPGSSTSAFTVSFDYEVPEDALKVTNEFIEQLLSQDTTRRNTDATEITKLLERDVKRLQDEHSAILAQIDSIKQRPPDQKQAMSEEMQAKLKSLAILESELDQKTTIYSDEYPAIKELRRKIAALKRAIAAAPRQTPASNRANQGDVEVEVFKQRAMSLQTRLDDATNKLAMARLSENMQQNQQVGRLQLIQQPELPHKPVTAGRFKVFAEAIALAAAIGAGCVFAAEMLDGSIRRPQQLASIVDRKLIVAIPFIPTLAEQRRKRRNLFLMCVALLVLLGLGLVVVAVMTGTLADLDQLWIRAFTRP